MRHAGPLQATRIMLQSGMAKLCKQRSLSCPPIHLVCVALVLPPAWTQRLKWGCWFWWFGAYTLSLPESLRAYAATKGAYTSTGHLARAYAGNVQFKCTTQSALWHLQRIATSRYKDLPSKYLESLRECLCRAHVEPTRRL